MGHQPDQRVHHDALHPLVLLDYQLFWRGSVIFSEADANRMFAWIPLSLRGWAVWGAAGCMLRWIRSGLPPVQARLRLAGITAVLLLGTAAVPLMPTASLAAAAISLSFFLTIALSVAVYALPLDLFGPARAGFSIAALTCALKPDAGDHL